jgi:hypothetical protein
MSTHDSLIGQCFGRLTVVRRQYPNHNNSVLYVCQCKCGNQLVATASHLRCGATQSCGCLRREYSAQVDRALTGKRFGGLIVIEPWYPRGKGARYLCVCQRGQLTLVSGGNLRAGNMRSCGCLGREAHHLANLGHGCTGIHLYVVWRSMLARCYNAKHISYRYYGGRGITVCQGLHKFENFRADFGDHPPPGMSVDRIDNDGHYSCGKCEECRANNWRLNCRWATPLQQRHNRRGAWLPDHDNANRFIAKWVAGGVVE